ncbi:competence/damage-inducible protein A [Zhaonella formicivorans]|uniref:competence/damage-inducible protein A n=1 Tax=Zhaonella formicivorans TaxID=2528593 RepID=UPI0010F3F412|nr:competence/damage-inducible protein A [Zhaonella formicivorans]
MKAYLIFTGTELLLGQIVNTNAQYLARQLADRGIDLFTQVTVGDNRKRIAEAIAAARGKADLVIINGGLGPTEDDVTREALADALGLELVENPEALEIVKRFFELRGLPFAAANMKQALAPAGARVLDNRVGTAPGLMVEQEGSVYVLLPGPPREMEIMFTEQVIPYLKANKPLEAVIKSRVLKVIGLGEPLVEEKVRDLIASANPTLAPTVKMGEVHLRITAKAENSELACRMIAQLERQVRERLGEYIFGVDEETLEQAVGGLLSAHKLTIATAESCTGGLLAHRLTNVPGSSNYFQLGAVTYANRFKNRLLGVGLKTLSAYGAVSPNTAREMAKGIREYAHTDLGVGITGIAGPGGGSAEKPVGLVYLAVDFRGEITVHREQFLGDRQTVKARAVHTALMLLWQKLKSLEPDN